MEVDGVGALIAKLNKAKARVHTNLDEAAGDAAEQLLEDTLPFVPISTEPGRGRLRDSGHVAKYGHADYSVVFGGAHAPYAIYVHEILENRHTPPTKAKFLEDTYTANRGEYAASIKNGGLRGIRDA